MIDDLVFLSKYLIQIIYTYSIYSPYLGVKIISSFFDELLNAYPEVKGYLDDAVSSTKMFFYVALLELIFAIIAGIMVTIIMVNVMFSYISVHGTSINPVELAIKAMEDTLPIITFVAALASIIDLILKYSIFKIGASAEKFGILLSKLKEKGIDIRSLIGRELDSKYVGLSRMGIYLLLLGVISAMLAPLITYMLFTRLLQSISVVDHVVHVDYGVLFSDPLLDMLMMVSWVIAIIILILIYKIMTGYSVVFNVSSAKTIALIYIITQVLGLLGALAVQAGLNTLKDLLTIVVMIVFVVYAYKLYSETKEKTNALLRIFTTPSIE